MPATIRKGLVMADDNSPQSNWHLDKRIPLALIATILGQTLLAVWWASAISSNITALQSSDARQDVIIERGSDRANAQAVQLGRIEEISLNTQRAIEALSRQIENMP